MALRPISPTCLSFRAFRARVQRDLYCAYLGNFVECDRLDAKRAAAAWAGGGGTRLAAVGVGALLRAASSQIKTPSGRSSRSFGQQGFRLPHVLPHMHKLRRGVGGVRSHNGVVKHREASGVASARNGESGAGYAEPRPSGRGSFTKGAQKE